MEIAFIFAPINRTTMHTTAKNPTKKSSEGEDLESTDPSFSMEYGHRESQVSIFLNAGLIIISLISIISLSKAHGNLFLKELIVSSLIIIALMFFRLLDSKKENNF